MVAVLNGQRAGGGGVIGALPPETIAAEASSVAPSPPGMGSVPVLVKLQIAAIAIAVPTQVPAATAANRRARRLMTQKRLLHVRHR
jgi:hypothetical protein